MQSVEFKVSLQHEPSPPQSTIATSFRITNDCRSNPTYHTITMCCDTIGGICGVLAEMQSQTIVVKTLCVSECVCGREIQRTQKTDVKRLDGDGVGSFARTTADGKGGFVTETNGEEEF